MILIYYTRIYNEQNFEGYTADGRNYSTAVKARNTHDNYTCNSLHMNSRSRKDLVVEDYVTVFRVLYLLLINILIIYNLLVYF